MNYYNDRMRDFREKQKLKQREVAAALGISQQVYSRYELGIRPLPIELLTKLCKKYNISADWILGLNE